MVHLRPFFICISICLLSYGVTAQQPEQINPTAVTGHKEIMHPNYSPVDLRFLNQPEIPAGKRGFLRSNGDTLEFEDGTQAKFWGTNIQASALFKTSPNQIKVHAKRLSKLGFNLVRLHHHDSNWVQPNIFSFQVSNTLTLNKNSLQTLDLWIKALKDEGIYIWLDLNVGRAFTAEDGIENFEEIVKDKKTTLGRGFNYINDTIKRRMMEFNESYLNHINDYTGVAYKDEPAIINMMITNENDVTHHFGNNLLPNKDVPESNRKYTKLANEFAEIHQLSRSRIWRSWEYGPSKIFLNDLEHKFNMDMIKHLKQIGARPGITTTNTWGNMPLSSLPALMDGDIIDVHSYDSVDYFKTNPRTHANFTAWIGAAQVNGKPLSVSEWNTGAFPNNRDRFSAGVYLAALSSLQGWDAIMQYGYSQQPLNNNGKPSNYSTFNDPAMAMMPVAALLYRAGHVSQAKKTYALSLDQKSFYGQENNPKTSATIRTLIEQSRVVIDVPKTRELNWLTPAPLATSITQIKDPNKDFISKGQHFVRSDTGELTRNWADGIYTINSEKTQALMGGIGGKKISLNQIIVHLENTNAAVAVQSLTDQPITNSDNILITLTTTTIPSNGNTIPFISDPLNGTLTVKARKGLQLYLINKFGREFILPTQYIDGAYQILLDSKIDTYWLALKHPAN